VLRSSTSPRGSKSRPPSPRSPDAQDPYYSCSHLISRSFQIGIDQAGSNNSSSSLLMQREPRNISPFKLHHIVHSPESGFKAVGYIDILDASEKIPEKSLYIESDEFRP
jgi:hypothetical protein